MPYVGRVRWIILKFQRKNVLLLVCYLQVARAGGMGDEQKERTGVKCALSRCIRHKNVEWRGAMRSREEASKKKSRLGPSSSGSPTSAFFPVLRVSL